MLAGAGASWCARQGGGLPDAGSPHQQCHRTAPLCWPAGIQGPEGEPGPGLHTAPYYYCLAPRYSSFSGCWNLASDQ